MKAYKITGKLGDICSFVGGNEVKKGDMVYFHSESDMKQQCVAKPQENDMTIEAMKQAAVYFCNMVRTWKLRDETEPAQLLFKLRQAIEQAEKQEPVALQMDVIVVNLVREGINKHRARELAEHFTKHTAPLNPLDSIKSSKTLDAQPQREWVGLTDEELKPLCDVNHIIFGAYTVDFVRSIEAKLKGKNT